MWDINDQNTLLALILTYGNGTLLELRAEGKNEEAIEELIPPPRVEVTAHRAEKKILRLRTSHYC